ncbi:phage regulatory CII family protein [Stenotrophomonas sp.]|uniref:phage regulatory CII family protein n=1 Tax=Stenotrophomonas sp. TaxID=69392 RepID=UPI0028AD77B4|nr:phage regulatory CII family protein [Stenotrophomonas sp.]
MSGAVLRNKVNPNNSTHHLSLAEASEIMGVTGDDRMLHALAAEHGYMLRRVEGAASGSVISAVLAVSRRQGDLAQAVAISLEDGRITPNESSEIRRLCASIQADAADLAQRAELASAGGQ